jgi:hypothetical protein
MFQLEEILTGLRYLGQIPGFLRHPLTMDEARAILQRRLERRASDFLRLIRVALSGSPANPYRRLLELAGCEYGDVERLVDREGVEGALQALLRKGVYLTVEEFKGRRPVTRGGVTFEVDPGQLRNPHASLHLIIRTGGSRGQGTPVPLDLAYIRETAVDRLLSLGTPERGQWRYACWGIPGSAAMARILEYSLLTSVPVDWFSHMSSSAPGLHPRYRWSARVMHWGGRLGRLRLPRPVLASVNDPGPIMRWIARVRDEGDSPSLDGFVSSVVRLCQLATSEGLDWRGVRFWVHGEPLTTARLDAIRRTGAECRARYGTVEAGRLGYACFAPVAPDEVHVTHDLSAVIQMGTDGSMSSLVPGALLVSSLRPTAPFLLLNVSLGDRAMLDSRACGCPLEGLGWTTHLHTIRSFEKLTAGGMTFLDADVIRVLEEVLPARFGGGPTDYQLVEDEGDDARPRLRLLVRPEIGPVDADAVADAFLAAVAAGSGVERVMGILWQDARMVRVERRPPLTTATGKILHVHSGGQRSSAVESGMR